MNVQETMSSPVITIREDATVGEAAQLMLERATSCLPVLDNQGQLVAGDPNRS